MRTVRDGQMMEGEEGGLTLINDPPSFVCMCVCVTMCDVTKGASVVVVMATNHCVRLVWDFY